MITYKRTTSNNDKGLGGVERIDTIYHS